MGYLHLDGAESKLTQFAAIVLGWLPAVPWAADG
jgi:hypothetical protein